MFSIDFIFLYFFSRISLQYKNNTDSTMFGKINFPGKEKPSLPSPAVPQQQNCQKTKLITKPHKKQQKQKIQHQNSLKGSKFRVLNELLYTRPSTQALKYFQQHHQDFETYHEGFREQASKWSQNPLHTIISYLKKHYSDKNKLILDLGCGEAQLHQQISKCASVRSFDLVAKKEYVEVADIANLPVHDQTADACVFCLSLMGVNYIDFIFQATRVLKETGQLLIAEVQSRCKQWKNFIKMIESIGFECKANKTNNYFRLLYFKVNSSNKKKLRIEGENKDINIYSRQILGSCLYKKR